MFQRNRHSYVRTLHGNSNRHRSNIQRPGHNRSRSRDKRTDKRDQSAKDSHQTPRGSSTTRSPRSHQGHPGKSSHPGQSNKKYTTDKHSDKHGDKKSSKGKDKKISDDSKTKPERQTCVKSLDQKSREKKASDRERLFDSRKEPFVKVEKKRDSSGMSHRNENRKNQSRSTGKQTDKTYIEETKSRKQDEKHHQKSSSVSAKKLSKETPQTFRRNYRINHPRSQQQSRSRPVVQSSTSRRSFYLNTTNDRRPRSYEQRTTDLEMSIQAEQPKNYDHYGDNYSDLHEENNGRYNEYSDRSHFPHHDIHERNLEPRKEFEQDIYERREYYDEGHELRKSSHGYERDDIEPFRERRGEGSYNNKNWNQDYLETDNRVDERRQYYERRGRSDDIDRLEWDYAGELDKDEHRRFDNDRDRSHDERDDRNLPGYERGYENKAAENQSERYPVEGDYERDYYEQDYNIPYNDHDLEYKNRSSDVKGKMDFEYRDQERNDGRQNRYSHLKHTQTHGQTHRRNAPINQNQSNFRSFKRQTLLSRSQQHYRNTKKKFLTNRFRKPYRKSNISSSARTSTDKNKNNADFRRNQSKIVDLGGKATKDGAKTVDGQIHQQSDRRKANPQVDRGSSGCLLKEDRSYEERKSEGFSMQMGRQFKRSTGFESHLETDNKLETLQQPMLFIPNPDLQHGSRQTVDQFGNVINLSEVPQGGLAPMPLHGSNAQEMIFIPFGGNTILPENIVPVHQGGIPIGFVPQFVPTEPVQRNVEETAVKLDDKKEDNDAKAENINVKAGNKKTLTNEQRAKKRNRLMQKRKQNLVKEVEKKVLENLDRKSAADEKMKKAKSSDNQKSESVYGSAKKIARKDSKGHDVYEDVSDLEDVSEEEEENEHLSDWEKVSVDEIELDANERRPKFRKQNEPRTLVQHSLTKRKLNVRRAPSKPFVRSHTDGSKVNKWVKVSEKTDYDQPQKQGETVATIKQERFNVRENKSLYVPSRLYSDQIEKSESPSTEKRVFRAYTASRVSQALKHIELEKSQNFQEQSGSDAKDRKNNLEDQTRNTSRAISPLQVTVRNNLYERKEHDSDDVNDFEAVKRSADQGIRKNAAKHEIQPKRDLARYKSYGNRAYQEDHRFGDESQFDASGISDKRIIRERKQNVNSATNREDGQRDWTVSVSRKENNDNEMNRFENQRDNWHIESSRTEDRPRSFPTRNREFEENPKQRRDADFKPDNRDEKYRNYPRRGEVVTRAESTTLDEDKKYHHMPKRYRGTRDQSHTRRQNAKTTDSYSETNDRRTERFQQQQRYDSRNVDSRTRNDDLEFRRKRRFGEDMSNEVPSRKEKRSYEDEEHNFHSEMSKKGREETFDHRGDSPLAASDISAEAQERNTEKLDPSLPPVQNMPIMTAPPMPQLPDMSLPPPQLVGTHFPSSSQVIIQNPPLLNEPSQIQNVQQPQQQIIRLQPSQSIQPLQNQQSLSQQALTFQPQSAGMQQSFQQQALAQQQNLGALQQQSGNQQMQLQGSGQQTQQRGFQVVIDHSQPLLHQLSVSQQQNVPSQQQQPLQQSVLQQPQSGSAVSFSQLQNLNQPISIASQQQQQGQIVTNQSPFQTVQQTLNTLGINQGVGMQARIVGVGQGQGVIQDQVGGQSETRGYLVPASFTGSLQGYSKNQF